MLVYPRIWDVNKYANILAKCQETPYQCKNISLADAPRFRRLMLTKKIACVKASMAYH